MPFTNCERDFSPIEIEKFFHPDMLSQLYLDKISNFWKNDSIKSFLHPSHGNFSREPGFLDGYHYRSIGGKLLQVDVFKSQGIAIEAMEALKNDVAALIFSGDSYGEFYETLRDLYWSKDTQKRIEDKWWWSIYGLGYAQRSIFINKWNTIIRAGNLKDDLSESTRILMEDTAIEIARRVDVLSEL